DLAGGAGMDAPPAVEGEQRGSGAGCGIAGTAPFRLRRHEGADPRSVRDQPVLPEFAAADFDQVPSGIDVAEADPACLGGAQPESVAQGEDRLVDVAAPAGPGVVGKPGGGGQQVAGLDGGEQERDASGGR